MLSSELITYQLYERINVVSVCETKKQTQGDKLLQEKVMILLDCWFSRRS